MLVRLAGFLLVVALGVWLWAIFDALTAPPHAVRGLPKGLWVAVVLILTVPGAVAWLLFGRPVTVPESAGRRRVVAPDDDPDFLRRLGEQRRGERDDPLS